MGITEVRAEESRKIRWSYSAFQLKYERKVESKIQNITIRMQKLRPAKRLNQSALTGRRPRARRRSGTSSTIPAGRGSRT